MGKKSRSKVENKKSRKGKKKKNSKVIAEVIPLTVEPPLNARPVVTIVDGTMEIDDFSRQQYHKFGMYVIESRAIPGIDGLKPVQRRVLYSMYDQGSRPGGRFKKCAAWVGDVIARYHPHGDVAVYDTLVRMVNPTPMLSKTFKSVTKGMHPFAPIVPQGNFGCAPRSLNRAAAYRYTESKLSHMGMCLFETFDAIERVPNFDNSTTEPHLLAPRFPWLLLMGTTGIAVAAASSIPRHGLGAVLDVAQKYIQNPKAALRELVACLRGPDWGHSSITSSASDIAEMYKNGKGRIRYCCDYEIVPGVGSNPHALNIKSFAPGFNVESFMTKCKKLIDEGHLVSCNDTSGAKGSSLRVQFSNTSVIEDTILPALNTSETYNWNIIDHSSGSPKLVHVTLKSFLGLWLDHQRVVETKLLNLELSKLRLRLKKEQAKYAGIINIKALMYALSKKIDDEALVLLIKETVKFTWAGKTRPLDDAQVNYLLDSQIRSLRALNAANQKEKIVALLKEIKAVKIELLDIDGVIVRHIARLRKKFSAVLNVWEATGNDGGASDGSSAISALNDMSNAKGFIVIQKTGTVKRYENLPERRGKWHNPAWTIPDVPEAVIARTDGTITPIRTRDLQNGRTLYKGTIGIVGNTTHLLLIGTNGVCQVVPNRWAKIGRSILCFKEEGIDLVNVKGLNSSDRVWAYTKTKHLEIEAQELIKKAKRIGSKGWKIVPRSRTAVKIIVIPRGCSVTTNTDGATNACSDIGFTDEAFAVGPNVWLVDMTNKKRICRTAGEGIEVSESAGIASAEILR